MLKLRYIILEVKLLSLFLQSNLQFYTMKSDPKYCGKSNLAREEKHGRKPPLKKTVVFNHKKSLPGFKPARLEILLQEIIQEYLCPIIK